MKMCRKIVDSAVEVASISMDSRLYPRALFFERHPWHYFPRDELEKSTLKKKKRILYADIG